MFIAKNEDVIVLANEREDTLKEILDRSFMTYTTIEETDINYILHNGQYVTQEEIDYQEKVRIANLKLTKREVFLGLYQAKGVTPDQIKAQITDPMALIEFEYANDYYRGNPLIDSVGAVLGITPEQLDCFFETKDYTCLLPVEEPEEPVDDGGTEYDIPEEVENDSNTDNIV